MYFDAANQEYNDEPLVMALGFFDGIHKGHQSLMKKALNSANKEGYKSSVMSFKKHPLTEVFPTYSPKLLMDNDQKIEKFKNLGIDYIFLEDFDRDLMKLAPEEFIRDFLLKKFNIKKLIVGFNYTFGYKGEGRILDLIELGEKYGFDVEIIEPNIKEDKIISSTYIRELIDQGNVQEANELLGHPYKVVGTIQEGKKLGRQYKIPTANLKLKEDVIMPKNGVYYTKIKIDDKVYDGLTNVGYNPTFKDHPYSIETYIYDFNNNIYGKEVELEFLDFIRGEIKFDNLQNLFEQIRSDIRKVNVLYRNKGQI